MDEGWHSVFQGPHLDRFTIGGTISSPVLLLVQRSCRLRPKASGASERAGGRTSAPKSFLTYILGLINYSIYQKVVLYMEDKQGCCFCGRAAQTLLLDLTSFDPKTSWFFSEDLRATSIGRR